jgi:hypothetical protein
MPYEELGLFDASLFRVDGPAPATPAEHISAGRKLTKRQQADVEHGRHPLTGGALHAEAAPAEPRSAPGRRCGNCRFRESIGHHDKTYPKCQFGGGGRVTSGAASDVRAWWPGCTDHQPVGAT